MQIYNIHEAKTNLSKLIEKTSKGEEVIIAKAGKPVAKLSSYKEKLKPRKLGLWKGKVFIPDNFDEEDEEINKLFYEGDIFPK
ncbi:type II toxin-antitoxin system Phd/YefM family antitoxin [Candidatus Daviesbacteria bacterium]|nr:type II toxin-antitoxin system Phd/YefM family antitoxin [Candidatus Daviesbacteria bacterium]